MKSEKILENNFESKIILENTQLIENYEKKIKHETIEEETKIELQNGN